MLRHTSMGDPGPGAAVVVGAWASVVIIMCAMSCCILSAHQVRESLREARTEDGTRAV